MNVECISRRPIDDETAARVTAITGGQANALATIEYQFEEGFSIRIVDMPVRYDPGLDRQLVNARIGGPLHNAVMALADRMREQTARPALKGLPLSVSLAAKDMLPAA